jgi:aspartyl-tRNA(Asn)/glutamyl-tRNA(Gln) amidotransferase subunit A
MIIGFFPTRVPQVFDDNTPAKGRARNLQHSILELSDLLRCGEISPVELTQKCLARIEKLNPVLNAFITVTPDSAIAQARQAEAEMRNGGWRGPLHGIPLGLKDLLDTAGIRTTAASAIFKDRIPAEDADVVTRLKAAGAVLLGKQNLHEFAYGGSSMISYYGEVRNAWNPNCIAGGSSGGSTTAVAAGMCLGAIGTDTAGSIREPAALCGVVGLKPTYGRVGARGVVPLSVSLDHVGPIALTVADCAAMFDVISGKDKTNGAAAKELSSSVEPMQPGLRVGVLRGFFCEDLGPEVASAFDQALVVLEAMVGGVRDLQLPVPTDRTLQSAESYAYHAEFVRRSPGLYQPETLRRILTGERISQDELRARRLELERTRLEIGRVFEDVDLLVAPTTPIPAPSIAELKENPDLLRPCEILLLRNTRPFNVWGLPAISVPCGFTQTGLPVGLQIAGPHWAENRVLQLAQAYEQATAWHKRQPAIGSAGLIPEMP